MALTGFRRFDIFLAKMKNDIEPHYILIVSNYKMNIKSTEVNAVMISSKLKKLPSHVDFEGFGLTKPSQVKCEKLMTVLKSDLIKKVGNIEDINLQIKIENALSQQLQLSSNYSNFDALDLENLFIDNNNIINNDKVNLEKLKSNLYTSYRNKEYNNSIVLAYRLKEFAENSKFSGRNTFIWYSLYMMSLSNLKLDNVEEALIKVKECLLYINTPQTYDKNYGLSLWLLSSVYTKIEEIGKSFKILKSLTRYYKNNYENLLRTACLFNIAKIKNNKKAMTNIYNILENIECTNRSIYNKPEYKENLRLEMKMELDAFSI